jgi:hypothetical protein
MRRWVDDLNVRTRVILEIAVAVITTVLIVWLWPPTTGVP